MSDVTIYHNPACSNSRGALALIRERGIEPRVIEYLKDPPDAATLGDLLRRMGMSAKELLRTRESAWTELGLDAGTLSDEQIIAQMVKNPRLMNRPVVVTPRGAKLCRPPELVAELLP